MTFESLTSMHHLMITGSSVASGPRWQRLVWQSSRPWSQGYALNYILKQVDCGPAEDAAGCYRGTAQALCS